MESTGSSAGSSIPSDLEPGLYAQGFATLSFTPTSDL